MDPATVTNPTDPATTQSSQPSDSPASNTPPAENDPANTAPADGNPATTADPAAPAADQAQPTAEATDKPFLGNPPPKADEKPADDPNAADKPADDPNAPKPPDEKDYLDAIKKDEAIFGKNDDLVFDQKLVKSVVPVLQKHNIPATVANEIANAFAKAQFEGARAEMKARSERFADMNGKARARFSDADFQQINRGIDMRFKPGGVMNGVIRNSELGSDPEFLALMHELGAAERIDTGKGTAEAGGAATGDPSGPDGLSKIW